MPCCADAVRAPPTSSISSNATVVADLPAVVLDPVLADFRVLADLEVHLRVELPRVAGEAEEDQHDADVHDVAAVAPFVAADQTDERRQHVGAGVLAADHRAAPEFLTDRADDQTAEREAQARRPERNSERHRRAAGG